MTQRILLTTCAAALAVVALCGCKYHEHHHDADRRGYWALEDDPEKWGHVHHRR